MKVSIITATFNSSKTVKCTLESVSKQTYQNIEHIIIDGNSKDNTVSICTEFSHINKIISEPDDGIYDAMNKGLRQATGDIVAILNSDDFFYDDDVIYNVVQSFLEEKSTDIIYGNTLAGEFSNSGELISVSRIVRPGSFDRSKFISGWMPSHVSVYIRKSVYDKYGLFSTDYKIGADYELLLRFMYKEKVKSSYLNKMCVCFRVGGISTSGLKSRILMLQESKSAWKTNNLRSNVFTPYLKVSRGMVNLITTKLETLLKKDANWL